MTRGWASAVLTVVVIGFTRIKPLRPHTNFPLKAAPRRRLSLG